MPRWLTAFFSSAVIAAADRSPQALRARLARKRPKTARNSPTSPDGDPA